MNQIEHIVNPDRLLLVWRGATTGGPSTRRIVAELVTDENSEVVFRYFHGSEDFERARKEGFQGYPAFDVRAPEHSSNVLDSFMRRLPPRKRDDFLTYLHRHRIPASARLSDMSLLGYTNAKLPSDGFELYADLSNARPPFELVIEVAGFRYQHGACADDLYVGDPVSLKPEPENEHDLNAIAIYHSGKKIGFVDRAQAPSFLAWMRKGFQVHATVERINGKSDRPLVYLYVAVR